MGLGVWASNRRVAPKLAVLTTIAAAPHSKSGTRTRARSVCMRGITSGSRAINAESCCAGGTLVRWHSPRIWVRWQPSVHVSAGMLAHRRAWHSPRIWVGWQPSVHVSAGMLAQRRARTAASFQSSRAVVGLWVWRSGGGRAVLGVTSTGGQQRDT